MVVNQASRLFPSKFTNKINHLFSKVGRVCRCATVAFQNLFFILQIVNQGALSKFDLKAIKEFKSRELVNELQFDQNYLEMPKIVP